MIVLEAFVALFLHEFSCLRPKTLDKYCNYRCVFSENACLILVFIFMHLRLVHRGNIIKMAHLQIDNWSFEFLARGRYGTVFRCGDLIMKIHADIEEGDSENRWLCDMMKNPIPHSLTVASTSDELRRAVQNAFLHKITYTNYAGRTLRSIINSGIRVDSVRIVMQILEFITHLGQKYGAAHCDLHSDNILINDRGNVTVCDYHFMEKLGTVITLDEEQIIPHYPPEYKGKSMKVSQEGDIWMIGFLFRTMGGEKIDSDFKADCMLLMSADPSERIDPARRLLKGIRPRSTNAI